MMKKYIAGIVIGLTVLLLQTEYLNAQSIGESNKSLSETQRQISGISIYTALGDIPNLKIALNDGLDSGLTINEIKEVLIHLYAYAGFPRSLNGLKAFMTVIDEREQNGIFDTIGKEANPLPENKNKYEFGNEVLTELVGGSYSSPLFEFVPAIDTLLKENLFADLFSRENLDYLSREIATISVLASLDGTVVQLKSHLKIGKNIGLTEEQLRGIAITISSKVGLEKGKTVTENIDEIFETNNNMSAIQSNESIKEINNSNYNQGIDQLTNILFPKGERLVSENFTGEVWLYMMIKEDSLLNTRIGNVVFEPGARTNWHNHPGGQILLVTDGTGYYQEMGKSIKLIHKGDVVICPKDVTHWHGLLQIPQ